MSVWHGYPEKQVLDARETARTLDTNGWIEIKGNPLSKVGVFDYSGESLGGAERGFDPNKIYKVYRSAEALSDPETIESFKLLPWIDDHPDALLGDETKGRIPAERKGISGVIGEDVYFEYPYLKGNLKLFSQKLAEKIQSGKIELSPGYLAKYVLSKGNFEGQDYDVIQINLRGNHMASVDQGRTGPDLRVLDSKETDETQEKIVDPEKKEVSAEASKDEGAGGLNIDGLLERLIPAITEVCKGLIAQSATADKGVKDEEEKKEDKKDDDKSAMDAAELRKSIYRETSQRNQLAEKLSWQIGTFDASEMTLDEVAKYGIKELGINCKPGHEQSVLEGYLAGAKVAQPLPAFAMDSLVKEENQIDSFIKGGK